MTTTPRRLLRARAEAAVASVVTVLPHEIPPLLSAAATFFFILSAYFVVLPLRDEGAISLGLDTLPGLFAGSLLLTVLAAPVASLAFSLPSIPKPRALILIHRFFSISLLAFFGLWFASSPRQSQSVSQSSEDGSSKYSGWENHSWFYIVVRISLFLWVSLLNLITISSTWARVIDVMDSESGSRLFGFIGAGATLGQLFGSLFAASMAWLGPFMLLFSSLLMELAAVSSKGICIDDIQGSTELSPTGAEKIQNTEADDEMSSLVTSPRSPLQSRKTSPEIFVMFEESNNNSYYNIKSSCQKENICTDKQLYSSFYSCGTAHFDGPYPYCCWCNRRYLCISTCCSLKYGCPCCMANLDCCGYNRNNSKGSHLCFYKAWKGVIVYSCLTG
ncbi:hypothetical protein SETIT_8G014900v2 [Setaria italica]|uniref:TLC ATP/ADP transporter n=1 Tax=Setaria italica TaxID=4555 RepID=A0A368S3D6_SETIT|nr:hypothetical protein SETIT_8G014900v2 [Setaria italica]